ncbi:hypothetical protein Daesc_007195 [Daldinia eschscholtzii]|uniref:Uncharacterized protein n=1 Tax=Daldinia eschscholtzii TaxID=292717 RepID=A0AAX6MDD4_9PEZI
MGVEVLTAYSEGNTGALGKVAEEQRSSESRYSALAIGIVLACNVSKFGQPQAGGKFPSPLDIFEDGVVQILSDVEAYMDLDKPLWLEGVERESDFMHRLADVREELAMIQEMLCQKEEILQSLANDIELYELRNILGGEGWRGSKDKADLEELRRSNKDIDAFQKRATKIDKGAERIDNLIKNQLNMMRTYASIRDAHTGLVFSIVPIAFAIITIIFTPLAFMTSLFALPLPHRLPKKNKIVLAEETTIRSLESSKE